MTNMNACLLGSCDWLVEGHVQKAAITCWRQMQCRVFLYYSTLLSFGWMRRCEDRVSYVIRVYNISIFRFHSKINNKLCGKETRPSLSAAPS